MAHTSVAVDQACQPFIGPYNVEFAVGSSPRLDEYRLRYRIFVEEHQWLSGDAGEHAEYDAFDAASCAFLLRDRRTGEPAACQRLILPDRLPAGLLTNVERLTAGFADECGPLTSDAWAEVSRTSIAPDYRWGGRSAAFPAIQAIKYASVALAVAFGRCALFSFSEPRTARLTRRLGFAMHQIGPSVELHGLRAPFRIDVAEVLHSVPPDMRASLDHLVNAAAPLRTSVR